MRPSGICCRSAYTRSWYIVTFWALDIVGGKEEEEVVMGEGAGS